MRRLLGNVAVLCERPAVHQLGHRDAKAPDVDCEAVHALAKLDLRCSVRDCHYPWGHRCRGYVPTPPEVCENDVLVRAVSAHQYVTGLDVAVQHSDPVQVSHCLKKAFGATTDERPLQ